MLDFLVDQAHRFKVIKALGERLPITEDALAALLNYGTDGERAVRQVFSNLGGTVDDLRLRAEVIRVLYGCPYGAAEVVALLNDFMSGEEAAGSGLFWRLADISDLPVVLDGMVPPVGDNKGFDRRGWEAGSFYARIFVRAWVSPL